MKTLTITVAFLLSAIAATAAEPDPLFQSETKLSITIDGPFSTLMRERSTETEYPATLRLVDADGEERTFDIQLRSRGNYRRRSDICDFTPLRVNFRKSEVENTVFANQDKLKLVTHCQARKDSYKHAVAREYLAYQILNLMTDASFRVRLLEVRYVDTSADRRDEVELAFFIESTERLAARIQQPEYQTGRISVRQLDLEHLRLTSVFQYLIGNTDFSPIASPDEASCCHNYRLFGDPDEKLFSIPYDFDMSGLVNAKHAKPNARFGLRSVTQRLYRGRCLNTIRLPETLALYQEQRDAILALVESTTDLNKAAKGVTRRFVERFFTTLDKPKRVQSRIVGDCI